MTANLQPYPEYKAAGLPWLPQMPAHWGIKRGKSVFQSIDHRSATGKEELLTVSSARGVVPRRTASVTMFKAESYLGYKLCWPGDLVINSLWAWGGGLGVSRHHGIISSAYGVYRIRSGAPLISDYVHELVRSSAFHWELQVRSKGVWISRLQLTDGSFLDAPIPLPPPEEQAAMVRFLDYANGRLERAVRAKRKVIALLHEQKQATLHRAVTGQDQVIEQKRADGTSAFSLQPSALPKKPSGIPWLGDIPKHWEVQRLKFLTHIKTGGRDTVDRIDDGPYPFFVRSQTVERIDTFSFDGEAVLTAGDGAGVGKVFHYVNGKFEYHQRVYKFSNFRRITGKFFFHYFKSSLRFEALDASAKSTVDSLRLPLLQNFPTVLPPTSEQQNIVRWIDAESGPVDTAISRLEREISLLREYRTRLVADVVTGKLDVRPAARHLPAETQEAETAAEIGTEQDEAPQEVTTYEES
jgi:type I restriction enzyme S subunit